VEGWGQVPHSVLGGMLRYNLQEDKSNRVNLAWTCPPPSMRGAGEEEWAAQCCLKQGVGG
jgi:hypothetical protein